MKKIFLFGIWILLTQHLWAQSVFSNAITGTNPNTYNPYIDGQVHDPNISVSGIGRGSGINGSNANNRYNASGWTINSLPDEQDYFEFTLTPSAGYQINLVTFSYSAQASASGPVQFKFRSSLDGFLSDIGQPVSAGSSIDLGALVFQNITTAISFRLYGFGGSSTAGTFSINDFNFTGTVTTVNNIPAITVTGTFLPFQSLPGQASPPQAYQVSGVNLTNDINIQAPAGYEISKTNTTGYTSTLVLTHFSGLVSTTEVFVRLRSDWPGNQQGTIQHSSPGSVTQSLNVNGLVLAHEPVSPSAIQISNVTVTGFTMEFNGGNGSGRLVVMRAGSPVTAVPIDGTVYTANPQLGSGQAIATNEFVVMAGAAGSVTVTGLTGNITYHIVLFEYNDAGIPSAVNYLGNGVTAQQLTIAAPLGLQIQQPNTVFMIDFDQSTDHTALDQFNGSGFSPSPLPGQLHSGAWAMSGWSDGNLNFNETRVTGDYARGFTLTHPSTGGVYAFEPSVPGNRALGIQAGTGDWAPGHLTLRMQNQTGSVINSLQLHYALYIFNNADRSSDFRFSWSADDVQYNDIASLQYQSIATADVQPVWDKKDQSIQLEGLSIQPGAWFYVRWSGSDVSGTGSRDEFALDDIRITANPVSGNPLPVRFTTLKAFEQFGGMLVSFETQLEENLEYYILERSLDGRSFSPLQQFSAKNDGSLVNQYHFLDQQPAPGTVYYRIRSAEINGQVTYSKILRISVKPATKDLFLYPNPVSDELVLQLGKLPAGRYNIWIHNAAGVVVMEKKLELKGGAHTETMTVGSLRAGWYSLRLSGPAALYRVFVKH